MPEFEHNEELTMPRNLSIYGVYSGHIFLLNMLLAYSKNQLAIAFILGTLYITTVLHWRVPYKRSWIHKMDIMMVYTTFASIGYYVYYYVDPAYHNQCFYHFCIVLCANCINKKLEYYQITEKVYLSGHPLLRYTYPNTIERENAYKLSIFTHCLFVHIWMSVSIFYYVYYHS